MPLLLLLASRIFIWKVLPFASEDAYITFRYARDFASGFGLVYNPGERVFGFSSPPWTLWSAAGYALLRNPLLWTRATSLVADLLTLLLVGRMLERHADREAGGPSPAAIFGYFFAVWPYFGVVSASGMEMSAMLALIALTAALATRGSPIAGVALGVLALWRPEGLAAAAVLGLGARPRARWIALAIAAAGIGALTWYFGSPVPQSMTAKAALYGTPGPWAGRFWWNWVLPVIDTKAQIEGGLLLPFAVLTGPALVAAVGPLWRRRRSALAFFVAACLVIWAGYALLGVAYFYWYLLVPLGGVAALAASGLPRLVRSRLVYAAAAVLVLSCWSVGYTLYVGRAQNEYNGFAQTARLLRASARPGSKVLLEPIGMVGYDCPLAVVDETGLVSPAVARRRLQGAGWYTDTEAAERPDWIVIRQGVLASGRGFAGFGAPFRSSAERDSLLARYQITDRIGDGENSLVILRRVRS
ncbi:MAG TPA: hypothetical protein VMS88_03675 [Terriglobales bacterium]|nr:hypothetical protein [Terriglobales bacterium]